MHAQSFNQQAVIAVVHQIAAEIVAFGVVNNETVGIYVTLAVAIINAAYLIAGGIHRNAHASIVAAQIAQPKPPAARK